MEVRSSHAKMRLKSAPQKLNFLMAKVIQKSYAWIAATNGLASFPIVTHCYTIECLRGKPFYVKQATFSTAWRTKNEAKPIADPTSISKVNMRSRRTVAYVSSYLHLKDFAWERD